MLFAALFVVALFGAIARRALYVANDQTVAASTSTSVNSGSLQAQLDANTQAMAALNQQIAEYQAELQKVGANKKTLQAALNALDL